MPRRGVTLGSCRKHEINFGGRELIAYGALLRGQAVGSCHGVFGVLELIRTASDKLHAAARAEQ